jgi:hypothetical protein
MRCPRTATLWLALLSAGCAPEPTRPEIAPGSGPSASPEQPPATETSKEQKALDPATLYARIQEAIETTTALQVDATDPLGEGAGGFDSDPRLPRDRIDCMTWLQWVLALAYADPDGDHLLWMDALRYYGGVVGFDTRKHYVDRWLWMEPGPLQPIDCPETLCQRESIQLDLSGVPAARQYPCGLWRSQVHEVWMEAIPQSQLEEVVGGLDAGFYVLFGLASERYLGLYGMHSGPMAQVHPALLRVDESGAHITHASTALERVAEVELSEWVHSNRRLHRGSMIYALDPSWSPDQERLIITEESRCSVR